MLLAQPDRARRDLHELVFGDVGQRPFQGHAYRRGEKNSVVLAGGTDVGELLALQHVELEIVAAGVLADDHALIDPGAGIDEHRPAVLQVEQRVSHRLAFGIG